MNFRGKIQRGLYIASILGLIAGIIPIKTTFAALPAPTIDSINYSYGANELTGSGTCQGNMMYTNITDSHGNVYFSGSPTTSTNTDCINGHYTFDIQFGESTITNNFDLNNPNEVQIFNLTFPDGPASPQPDDVPAIAFFTRTQPNTLPGTDVNVSLLNNQVNLNFTNVFQAGPTTVTVQTGGTPPPTGFQLGLLGTYFEISTQASFSSDVTVCFTYDPTKIIGLESGLTLLHFDKFLGTWVNITSSLDMLHHNICGVTNNFSPFILATAPNIPSLINMVKQMNLRENITDNLDEKLEDAQEALQYQDDHDQNDVIQKLYDFIKAVENQRNKKLTSAQADQLHLYAANLILLLIGNKTFQAGS